MWNRRENRSSQREVFERNFSRGEDRESPYDRCDTTTLHETLKSWTISEPAHADPAAEVYKTRHSVPIYERTANPTCTASG